MFTLNMHQSNWVVSRRQTIIQTMKLHLILLVSLVYLSVASMAYPSNSEVDIDLNIDIGEGAVLSKSRNCGLYACKVQPQAGFPLLQGQMHQPYQSGTI